MKKHPKGLISASLSNMGERYGFYTMIAILVLFLQTKFNLDEKNAGVIYSTFYAAIYLLSLVGGFIADRTQKYKQTILAGLIIMTIGYLLLAIPSKTPVVNYNLIFALSVFALFTIAFGNGLFKGNLQALVGQIYDNYEKEHPELTKQQKEDLRDEGYRIFYMFINVGAIFAPFTAVGIRNLWLKLHGFTYNAELPKLCYSYLDGTISEEARQTLTDLATKVSGEPVSDLGAFIHQYLDVFTRGFHYAFAVAIIAMLISLLIFIFNSKKYPEIQRHKEQKIDLTQAEIQQQAKEVKQRILALLAVFAVVIFFWFSFHQNGLTLTYFARDYTRLGNIFGYQLSVESFQSMNPFFVVVITLFIIGINRFIERYRKDNQLEQSGISTPKKIAIGMFIAALAYIVLLGVSIDLPPFSAINPNSGGTPLPDSQKVSPWVLITVYFILTVAELFISPLGLSFVSKVAPAKYQGIMQGAWLGATALGNQILFIGAYLYKSTALWITWSVFIVVTVISGIIMFSMVKWLERVTATKGVSTTS